MVRPLSEYKALSFDCYGTLIDWETGIYRQLIPLLERAPRDHPFQAREAVLKRFDVLRQHIERDSPKALYTGIRAQVYTQLAAELGVPVPHEEAQVFGRGVGTWPAFPDTVAGLQRLKKHFRLIIVSNVDNYNMQQTLQGPLAGVEFDAVVTAEDVGSYKPSHNNFKSLCKVLHEKFQLDEKVDLLHVAKSLPIDHVPAKELGLTSAWIARGEGGVSAIGGTLAELGDKVAFSYRFSSIGELADAVDKAYGHAT
jgi:2-haloalkanoic acid dehalogenase type II